MGIAYTVDGKRIDYNDYINSDPYWKKVRQARFDFDNGSCAVCHCDLHGKEFQTHHLTYINLGHEHLTDVITLCPLHHTIFHNNWSKQNYWKGKEEGHWDVFSIEHTAILCATHYTDDKFINGDPEAQNICNMNLCRKYVNDYIQSYNAPYEIRMDPNDFLLFVRNKRYEMVFEAETRGLTVEQFLDEKYGEKVRGKNPLRVEAGKKNGPFDHTLESFHRHYEENKNLLKLMKEAEKYE